MSRVASSLPKKSAGRGSRGSQELTLPLPRVSAPDGCIPRVRGSGELPGCAGERSRRIVLGKDPRSEEPSKDGTRAFPS